MLQLAGPATLPVSLAYGPGKADPMEGNDVGDQEQPYLFRHDSGSNVRKLQACLEIHIAVRRKGVCFKWVDAAGAYVINVQNNG